MDLLPDEMIMEIFRAINHLSDRARFSTVCKKFKKIYDNDNNRPKILSHISNKTISGYALSDSISFLAIGNRMWQLAHTGWYNEHTVKVTKLNECLIDDGKQFPEIDYILFEKNAQGPICKGGLKVLVIDRNKIFRITVFDNSGNYSFSSYQANFSHLSDDMIQNMYKAYPILTKIYDIYLKNAPVKDNIKMIFKNAVEILFKLHSICKFQEDIDKLKNFKL